MYQELVAALAALAVIDDSVQLPKPVQETASVVRMPADEDDRESWQGCTFVTNERHRIAVRFDDGRVMMAVSPAAAAQLYVENGDVWM